MVRPMPPSAIGLRARDAELLGERPRFLAAHVGGIAPRGHADHLHRTPVRPRSCPSIGPQRRMSDTDLQPAEQIGQQRPRDAEPGLELGFLDVNSVADLVQGIADAGQFVRGEGHKKALGSLKDGVHFRGALPLPPSGGRTSYLHDGRRHCLRYSTRAGAGCQSAEWD
jgi:hypothetical protein